MHSVLDRLLSTTHFRKMVYYPHRGTGGEGWMGPLKFLICCSVSKRFYLQWKAFDLLYKMRYILWEMALLGACDVPSKGRHLACHLGFYQELEIRFKPREMVIFFVLDMKNNINKHFARF